MNSTYDFSIMNVLRKRLNLTLQKLADEAGLTYPTVETIEANKKMPSLRTLDALAGALQISTSQLISLAERRRVQKRRAKEINSLFDNNGDNPIDFCKMAAYDKAKILRAQLPKGKTVQKMELHEDSNEFCYVLKGRLSIQVEKNRYELDVDDTLLFDGVLEHFYEAIEDSEFLTIHIPKDQRIIEALLSQSPPISIGRKEAVPPKN